MKRGRPRGAKNAPIGQRKSSVLVRFDYDLDFLREIMELAEAYLAMMAIRLIELHRVLGAYGRA